MKTDPQRLDLLSKIEPFRLGMLVKKYSLKTVPTNYIVWQMVIISNFGLL